MSENTQAVKALYEAFGRGDIPYVLGALDPQCVWNEAENHPYAKGNPYIGPQAILSGVFGHLGTEWDGFSANPEHFVSEGDTVISRGRYRGTFKPSGAKLDAQFVHVFTVKGGKITGFQQYTDTAQFQQIAQQGVNRAQGA